jgi:predicted nucleic acid-binding protein
MPVTLLLDSTVLGKVVHPDPLTHRLVVDVVAALIFDPDYRVVVPEIIDYEIRRNLLLTAQRQKAWATDALSLLDEMVSFGYEKLKTETFRLAAQIWADSRLRHQPRAPEAALDIDVILAAQARGANGLVVTENLRHFRDIAELFDLQEYARRNHLTGNDLQG